MSNGPATVTPTRARARIAPFAWVACSSGVGLLVCSAANALSRATLGSAELVFWAGIGLLVLPVFYRLLAAEPSTNERLALVCLLGLGLYVVKFLHEPFVYTFPDELAHQYNLDQIAHHHHLFSTNPLLPITSRYPGLEGAASALRELTGISSFAAGLLLIGAARLTMMVALFLLFTKSSGSPRIGGLGAAIYTANSNFLFFGAQFSYESLALPLFVVLLAVLAARDDMSPSGARGCAIVIVLLTAAIVATHHVTSYALVIVLWVLAILHLARRRLCAWPSPWPYAIVATVMTALWLVVVASETVGYLTPVIGHAFSNTFNTIAGESKPRQLFTGSGPATPGGEQLVAYASVALLAAALPVGLKTSWRYRSLPFALLLSGGAVVLFAMYPLRFAPAAWETAGRAAEFLFIGLSFVVGCACVKVVDRIRSAHPWLVPTLVTACFGIVFAGGVISGWPASSRMSQPLRIVADGRVIESERLALAHWVSRELPRRRFVSNSGDARLVNDFGHALVVSGSVPDYQDVITSPRLAPFETAVLGHHRIRYVISDRQLELDPFFSVRGANANQELLPWSTVRKFDHAPAAAIYDSGDVLVYDLKDRP